MRLSAVMMLCALASPADAEFEAPAATIPDLPKSGAAAEDFAPAGWVVEARAEGDLDGDGKADLAVVLRGTDPRLRVKNEGLGPNEVDTNPRVIAVAVSHDGRYRLAASNATLIPRNDIPTREDPFYREGFGILNKALRVELTLFMSAGGWGSSNIAFIFRLDGDDLRAIGYDRTDIQRNSGETETISVNYLTGRMSRSKGSIEGDPGKEKKSWSRIAAKRGPLIGDIGDGLEFDPAPSR